MTISQSEAARRSRERHPERARLAVLLTRARGRAARRVAKTHPTEYEAAIQEECQRLGIPRRLPPLPLSEDYRALRHTLEDGQ